MVRKQAYIDDELPSSGKTELESSHRQQTVGWSCRKPVSRRVTEAYIKENIWWKRRGTARKNDSFNELPMRGNNFNIHRDRILLCVIISSGGHSLRPVHELDHLVAQHLVQ